MEFLLRVLSQSRKAQKRVDAAVAAASSQLSSLRTNNFYSCCTIADEYIHPGYVVRQTIPKVFVVGSPYKLYGSRPSTLMVEVDDLRGRLLCCGRVRDCAVVVRESRSLRSLALTGLDGDYVSISTAGSTMTQGPGLGSLARQSASNFIRTGTALV